MQFSFLGDIPNPEIEPRSPTLQADSLPSKPPSYLTITTILASLVAQLVKNLPAIWETWVPPLGCEDPLDKRTATHSSILACRSPRTEEPGRLQSMGSQRVGHD